MKKNKRKITKLPPKVAHNLALLIISMLADHFGIPMEVVVILEIIFELLKLWRLRAQPAQSQRH